MPRCTQLVAPWLIGPTRFRCLAVGLGCAAVVGAVLVHDDGVDFHVLEPTWLAIGLFVAIPGLFGLLIGPAVDRVRRTDRRSLDDRRRSQLAVGLVAAFPLTRFVLALLTLGVCALSRCAGPGPLRRLWTSTLTGLAVRIVWLLIAVAGLTTLIRDIGAII